MAPIYFTNPKVNESVVVEAKYYTGNRSGRPAPIVGLILLTLAIVTM